MLFFHLLRFMANPIIPNIANNWSMFPKSKDVKISQQISGRPIICPASIISEYEAIAIIRNLFFIFFLSDLFTKTANKI